MFRFDNYCEKWAEIFKPISHDPAKGSPNQAFYRMDALSKLDSLCANLSGAKSPAMAVVTQIDAETEGQGNKFFRHMLHAVFLVKQEEAVVLRGSENEINAANAKALGFELAEKFLAYMSEDKLGNPEKGKQPNPDLRGLNFDKASVMSSPVMFGNWWAVDLVVENVTQRRFCVDSIDY